MIVRLDAVGIELVEPGADLGLLHSIQSISYFEAGVLSMQLRLMVKGLPANCQAPGFACFVTLAAEKKEYICHCFICPSIDITDDVRLAMKESFSQAARDAGLPNEASPQEVRTVEQEEMGAETGGYRTRLTGLCRMN